MKNRIILLLIIIITTTLASCAPTSEAESDKTEYQNTATTQITATSTTSYTPKPTITLTLTASPTLTSTVEPMIPLPELIQNLSSEETEEVLRVMREQFPANKENNSYHLFCVGSNLITHDPAIQLPDGTEISHTFYCQYYDAEGNQQGFHVPAYSYNLNDASIKYLGYWPIHDNVDSVVENVELQKYAFSLDPLPEGVTVTNRYKHLGWTGPGHIFYLNFAIPDDNHDFSSWTSGGYYNEAIQSLMTPEQLENFTTTGNEDFLLQTPSGEALMLPVDVSLENVFGNIQHRNYEDARND